MDRPLSKVEPELLDALRLGCYQLLRTRIPAHAAVDSTVDLVRADLGSRVAGFTNAVLRKVTEQDEDAWVRQLAPDPEQVWADALRSVGIDPISLPSWMPGGNDEESAN